MVEVPDPRPKWCEDVCSLATPTPRTRVGVRLVSNRNESQGKLVSNPWVLPANTNKKKVDPRGLEPLTSAMRGRRSPN